jgi:hypothetical protein
MRSLVAFDACASLIRAAAAEQKGCDTLSRGVPHVLSRAISRTSSRKSADIMTSYVDITEPIRHERCKRPFSQRCSVAKPPAA